MNIRKEDRSKMFLFLNYVLETNDEAFFFISLKNNATVQVIHLIVITDTRGRPRRRRVYQNQIVFYKYAKLKFKTYLFHVDLLHHPFKRT